VVILILCISFSLVKDPSVKSFSGDSGGKMNGAQTSEMIEAQNDRMVEEMAGKVKQLRAVRIKRRI
jgi:hypothetical protein